MFFEVNKSDLMWDISEFGPRQSMEQEEILLQKQTSTSLCVIIAERNTAHQTAWQDTCEVMLLPNLSVIFVPMVFADVIYSATTYNLYMEFLPSQTVLWMGVIYKMLCEWLWSERIAVYCSGELLRIVVDTRRIKQDIKIRLSELCVKNLEHLFFFGNTPDVSNKLYARNYCAIRWK